MINKNIVTYLSEATSKYIPIYLSNPIKETHQPKIPCNGKKSKMAANKNKRYIRLYDQLMYDKTHGISPANATKWNETPNNQYSQKQVFFPVNQLQHAHNTKAIATPKRICIKGCPKNCVAKRKKERNGYLDNSQKDLPTKKNVKNEHNKKMD